MAGQGGVVTMTSGKDVYIGTVSSPASTPLVMVKMSGAGGMSTSGTGVVNAGSVRAPGGTVRIGAGDLFAAAIYNSGTIAGSQVTLASGKGTNISSGTIDASNSAGKGGRVEMLGSTVAMTGRVDASGSTGGGDVRIGGDFHGEGRLPTSEKTVVTGTVKADATGSGAGGTVVVWSEKETVFTGTLSAVGAGGGAGGSAEVSSAVLLDFNPTSVQLGGGELLLDPLNIVIQDSTATVDVNADGTPGDDFNNKNQLNNANNFGNTTTSIISSTALNGILNGGGTPDVDLVAHGNITIATSATHINITGTNNLTLNAPNINIGDIWTGNVLAGASVATVHVTGTGASLSQAVAFTPTGTVLTIEGGTYTGAVTVASNITVNAANGTVVADSWSTGAGKSVTMSGGFQSAGNIALAANTTLGGTTVLTGGNISISGPVAGANNTLQLVSTGDETITSTVVLGTGQFTSTGVNFSLSSGVLGANNITLCRRRGT